MPSAAADVSDGPEFETGRSSETPFSDSSETKGHCPVEMIAQCYRQIIRSVGEDVDRQGLLKTPERAANAMLTFTKGYEQNLEEILNHAIFDEDHDEVVIVRDIDMFSLCEHHLLPFMGKVHIGECSGCRSWRASWTCSPADCRERLTKQIATAISEALHPHGVAVVIEASHLCMAMRGVQKMNAKTTTSCMLGEFRDNPKTRDEFLALIRS